MGTTVGVRRMLDRRYNLDSDSSMDETDARKATFETRGKIALRDHVVECALAARRRHGDVVDEAVLRRMLEDRRTVRYPVEILFDAGRLEPGEFAHAEAIGAHPSDGFRIIVHPHFRNRSADLPLLVAYHLVSVNYGDVVTHEEAELFGATLLGLDREVYYRRICALADELMGGARDA